MNASYPSSTSDFPSIACYYLAGCLRVFGNLFDEAMRREITYTPHTARDWKLNLHQLVRAAAPIDYLLHRSSGTVSSQFIHRNSSRLAFFRQKVEAATGSLARRDLEPVRDIHAALYAIVDAVEGLRIWQQRLCCEYRSHGLPAKAACLIAEEPHQLFPRAFDEHPYPEEEIARREIERCLNLFRLTISEGDDAARCRYSRKVFFAMYCTGVVHPRLWTRRVHGEIIQLHEEAVIGMDFGRFKENIENRIAVLRSLTPGAFRQRAVASPNGH